MLRHSYLSKHNATKWLLIASPCDELVDHLPLCSKTSKASQKWQRMFTKGKFAADLVPEASIFACHSSIPPHPRHPPPPSCRHPATPVTSATSPPTLTPEVRAPVLFGFSQAQITLRTKRGAAHSLSLPESFC